MMKCVRGILGSEAGASGVARWSRHVLVRSVFILIAFGPGCAPDCEEGGHAYDDGDVWTCSDGCNTCFCRGNTVGSTLMECADDTSDRESGSTPATCTDDDAPPATGQSVCSDSSEGVHEHGQSWTCADGCNDCICLDGEVARTGLECSAGGSGAGQAWFAEASGGSSADASDVAAAGGGSSSRPPLARADPAPTEVAP